MYSAFYKGFVEIKRKPVYFKRNRHKGKIRGKGGITSAPLQNIEGIISDIFVILSF